MQIAPVIRAALIFSHPTRSDNAERPSLRNMPFKHTNHNQFASIDRQRIYIYIYIYLRKRVYISMDAFKMQIITRVTSTCASAAIPSRLFSIFFPLSLSLRVFEM